MIRTTTAPRPWPLPWGDGKTHFMLRAGDVIERGEFEAGLAEMDAGQVWDWQLEEVFHQGVMALLPDNPEEVERIREISTAINCGEKVSREDQALIDSAKEAVRRAWPAYRSLLAQAARRNELIPTLAFQWFVSGWEGPNLPEHRTGIDGRLDISVMKAITPMVVRLAGTAAYQLLYATNAEDFFARPLPPAKSPKPSTKRASRKGGSSAARSGRKTPSSRSQNGLSE